MDKQQYANVAEPWVLYDSLIITPTEAQYGSELTAPGVYPSFAVFAQQQQHTFFKSRTEGMMGLEYTNQQSADSMDFAFEAYSIGLAFAAPGVRIQGTVAGTPVTVNTWEQSINHWFDTELPRHCAIQLKVNQDILCELPAMQASPGYGMSGGGASFQHGPFSLGVDSHYLPVMNFAATQGSPHIKNRFQFVKRDERTGAIVPNPIKIPRTASLEMILTVSEYAQTIMAAFLGPQNYLSNASDGLSIVAFPQRCIIQASLAGKRLVQQRAQYHR